MIPYGYIYKTENLITSDTYIGQSTRFYDDTYLGSGLVIIRAIKKYGRANFDREIICYCKDQEDLNHKERLYISLLKPSYNIANGGTGVGKHSIETRNKLSESHKGKPALNKGISLSKAQKEFLSRVNLGRRHTEATKKMMSEKLKGKVFSEITKERISLSKIKRVVCIETGEILDGLVEASLYATGCIGSRYNIGACCRGVRKQACGYTWKYTDKEISNG